MAGEYDWGQMLGQGGGMAAGALGATNPWIPVALGAAGSLSGGIFGNKAKKAAKKRLAEATARLEEARLASKSGGEHAKNDLAARSREYQAGVGQNLAERGLASSSAYDAATNDARDRETRARGAIDTAVGGQQAEISRQQADLLGSVNDVYDGQAVSQSLSSLGYSLGSLMTQKPGSTAGGGGAGAGTPGGAGGASGGGIGTDILARQPSGALYATPSGGTPVDPYAFNSGTPMTPGRQGFTPAAMALPGGTQPAVSANDAYGLPKTETTYDPSKPFGVSQRKRKLSAAMAYGY